MHSDCTHGTVGHDFVVPGRICPGDNACRPSGFRRIQDRSEVFLCPIGAFATQWISVCADQRSALQRPYAMSTSQVTRRLQGTRRRRLRVLRKLLSNTCGWGDLVHKCGDRIVLSRLPLVVRPLRPRTTRLRVTGGSVSDCPPASGDVPLGLDSLPSHPQTPPQAGGDFGRCFRVIEAVRSSRRAQSGVWSMTFPPTVPAPTGKGVSGGCLGGKGAERCRLLDDGILGSQSKGRGRRVVRR